MVRRFLQIYRGQKMFSAIEVKRSVCQYNASCLATSVTPLKTQSNKWHKDYLFNVDFHNINQPQTEKDLIQLLKNNIVFHKDGLLAITKPPGLAVSGTADNPNLIGVLPQLAEYIRVPTLGIIKAPEKESSGLILMATDDAQIKDVTEEFNQRGTNWGVERKYLAITIGIPEPFTGEIHQALQSEMIGDHRLTVPVKSYSTKNIKKGIVKKARTEYTVLSENRELKCALVQLKVARLRHHQIQVHLGQKACSILGDHLYSSRVKHILGMDVLARPQDVKPQPQVIPIPVRRRLGVSFVRQNQVPLYLHWYQANIPGREPIISTPLGYFNWTLKRLGLRIPDGAVT